MMNEFVRFLRSVQRNVTELRDLTFQFRSDHFVHPLDATKLDCKRTSTDHVFELFDESFAGDIAPDCGHEERNVTKSTEAVGDVTPHPAVRLTNGSTVCHTLQLITTHFISFSAFVL